MVALVPSYLAIDGAYFPLEANQFGAGLEESVEELEALRYAVDQMVNGDARDVPIEVLARDGSVFRGAGQFQRQDRRAFWQRTSFTGDG